MLNSDRPRRLFTLALLVGLALAGCGGPSYPPQVELTLLTTNDFHGALESEHVDRDTGRPLGGAPYLAATIARERAINPEGTILVDGGDIYQGTALSNLTDGKA
jgi:sulfur-oxidizing protein SoxB